MQKGTIGRHVTSPRIPDQGKIRMQWLITQRA